MDIDLVINWRDSNNRIQKVMKKETDLPEEKKQDDRCPVTGNYILNLNPTIGPPPKPNAQHYEVMIGDKLAFKQDGEWTINYPEKALDMLIESVRYLESHKQGWISVKERLPDENVSVLVFIPEEDEHITTGMWDVSQKWVLLDEYRVPKSEVTYWTECPEKPKDRTYDKMHDFTDEIETTTEIIRRLQRRIYELEHPAKN